MKTLFPVLAAPLLVLSCSNPMGTKGDGTIVTEDRPVAKYTRVTSSAGIHVEIQYGEPTGKLTVKGDKNLIAHVTTKVEGPHLHIGTSTSISPTKPIRVTGAALVDDASASGGARVLVKDFKGEHFDVNSSGGARVAVTGKAKSLDVSASGGSRVYCEKLDVEKAEVMASGGTKVHVVAQKTLKVGASGGSRVIYAGNPELNKSVSGGASVEKEK